MIRDPAVDALLERLGVDVERVLAATPERILRNLELAAQHPEIVGYGHQNFSELLEPVLVADYAAVGPAAATEIVLWTPNQTTQQHTWLAANSVRSGQAFKLSVVGVMTTPATPGTVLITPRWGLAVGGVSLGPSLAVAGVASQTNVPFFLHLRGTIRTIGATGVMVAGGTLQSAALTRDIPFGGLTATIDTTAAAGFVFGVTDSVISLSYTPKLIHLEFSG